MVLCCCPIHPQRIIDRLHAGKSEQWATLFQVLAATAHAQLDALYSGLQSTQEAIPYRLVFGEWCIAAALRTDLPIYFPALWPVEEGLSQVYLACPARDQMVAVSVLLLCGTAQ